MKIKHNMQREASTSTDPLTVFHCGPVGLQAGATLSSIPLKEYALEKG